MYSRNKAWNLKYNEISVTYEVHGSDQFSTRFWFLIISHLIVSVSHCHFIIKYPERMLLLGILDPMVPT